ncbi:hypothetical protein Bbelb_291430 [Branchiostoma belcheri]|nr:hypothetical protein Bbelb_291430 [Branchiostoma belcheri]
MANWTAELEAWKRRALAAEVTKKLAGAAAGTAAWVTNVGNEHGQILMSVLTAAEGQGLKPMGEGLVRRYRAAGVKHQDSCMWTSDCSCVRITPQPPRPLMVDDAALVCDHEGVLLPHPAVGPIQRPPDATLQLYDINVRTLTQWYNKRQKVQERQLLLQGVSQPSASTVSDVPAPEPLPRSQRRLWSRHDSLHLSEDADLPRLLQLMNTSCVKLLAGGNGATVKSTTSSQKTRQGTHLTAVEHADLTRKG